MNRVRRSVTIGHPSLSCTLGRGFEGCSGRWSRPRKPAGCGRWSGRRGYHIRGIGSRRAQRPSSEGPEEWERASRAPARAPLGCVYQPQEASGQREEDNPTDRAADNDAGTGLPETRTCAFPGRRRVALLLDRDPDDERCGEQREPGGWPSDALSSRLGLRRDCLRFAGGRRRRRLGSLDRRVVEPVSTEPADARRILDLLRAFRTSLHPTVHSRPIPSRIRSRGTLDQAPHDLSRRFDVRSADARESLPRRRIGLRGVWARSPNPRGRARDTQAQGWIG